MKYLIQLNWRKLGMAGFLFFLIKGLIWLTLLMGAQKMFSQTPLKKNKMSDLKVAVYDTYVTKKDGSIMHFDILVPSDFKDLNQIYAFGQRYLATKGQAGQPLTSKECRFCHIEKADDDLKAVIEKEGFSIIEMQGCN
jgi:hypothetical protein